MPTPRFLASSTLLALAAASPAAAITVELDFGSGDFFGSDTATARAAVQAAAADVGAALTSSLSAVDQTFFQGEFVGPFGASTATLDFDYVYTNPYGSDTVTVAAPVAAADTVRIFVGAKSLTDDTLGTGGFAGVGVDVRTLAFTGEAQAALDDASAQANAELRRGGPLTRTRAGATQAGDSYSVATGPLLGVLTFDNDASTTWSFDHTAAVAAGTADLYSVAVHEIIHALGFSQAESWLTNVDGIDWTGSEAIAANGGTGIGLLNLDADHIANGTQSFTLQGDSQEAAMDPSIFLGTRKFITELDLAFLRDTGWETVPEPGAGLLLAAGGLALLRRRAA